MKKVLILTIVVMGFLLEACHQPGKNNQTWHPPKAKKQKAGHNNGN